MYISPHGRPGAGGCAGPAIALASTPGKNGNGVALGAFVFFLTTDLKNVPSPQSIIFVTQSLLSIVRENKHIPRDNKNAITSGVYR